MTNGLRVLVFLIVALGNDYIALSALTEVGVVIVRIYIVILWINEQASYRNEMFASFRALDGPDRLFWSNFWNIIIIFCFWVR